MSTTTAGATIFYTTDETVPTHNGATPTGTTHVYTGPVTVGKCNAMFFEALAYKSGMTDSVVTTYNADYAGLCGGAQLFSDDATLSGSDASSDYQLVAYTEGSSARNEARRLIGDRPMRHDAAASMNRWNATRPVRLGPERVDKSDGGFMRVALNSSSPKRSGTSTATTSVTANTSAPTIIFSVWDGDWAVLEEYTTGNVLVQQYLQGYHGLVKTTLPTAVYYYQDELGSTSHIASATGALIESYQYDLYGKPRVYNPGGTYQPNATPVAKDLGNGGSRWIAELGLYDDRNRFMSPDLGRFLQPDPIGFKGDASNLYRYCGNDWANRTDLMGLLDGGINTILDPKWMQAQRDQDRRLRNGVKSKHLTFGMCGAAAFVSSRIETEAKSLLSDLERSKWRKTKAGH